MKKIIKQDPQSQSADIVTENIEKLQALFPEIITEGDGEKKIDFDTLKEVLGEYIEDKEERYSFTWHGKSRARRLAQTPSTGTLRPCIEDSVDWDTTSNLFIEGDNLEALKILQKSFHKAVDIIFIDPPYNTGKDFIYPDKYSDNLETYLRYTNQIDDSGFKVSTNTESSGRFHTNWLNMMYPRLKLAKNLLKDDGFIAVTINDAELHDLGMILDEIFGDERRLACAPWLSEASGGKEKTGLRTGHEYVLLYYKNTPESISQDERSTGELNLRDEIGPYRKGRELMKWGGTSLRKDRPNQFYPLYTPEGEEVFPYRNDGEEGHWRWGKANENIINALNGQPVFHWELRSFDEGVTVNGSSERWVPYEKIRDVKKSVGWSTWLDKYGTNADATRELKALFNNKKPFDTPKPSSLIQWFINLHSNENAIVLDFFAGSASTAHATLKSNFDDDGSRRFIMIQLPEIIEDESEAKKLGLDTIADIGKERVRRVSRQIKAENPKYSGDTGFRVYKLDASNIKSWSGDFENLEDELALGIESIRTDRTAEDLLYEILLKYGLDLTLPIEKHQIEGKTVYDVGMGALMVCLDDTISIEVVEGIGKLKEALQPEVMRVVFKDAGFANDVVKTNAVQVMKQFGIDDVRSI